MKRTIILALIIMQNLSHAGIFGNTEEEKIEFQQKILKNMFRGMTEPIKSAGKLLISPVTGKIKEYQKEQKQKMINTKRAKAKRKLLLQMQSKETNSTQRDKKQNLIIKIKEK